MYNALVRSHLDYCDVIYHLPEIFKPPLLGTLPGLMEIVEKVQYQAALAVSGAWKGTSRVKLYAELGWESLSDRRMTRRLLLLHKIIDKKSPAYLFEKLPLNRCVLIELPYVFQEVKCRTARYGKTFFPNAIFLWNDVICSFENFPTFENFKKHLMSLVRPKAKSIFNIFDPIHLRHLFQLRLGLSKLKYHKKGTTF